MASQCCSNEAGRFEVCTHTENVYHKISTEPVNQLCAIFAESVLIARTDALSPVMRCFHSAVSAPLFQEYGVCSTELWRTPERDVDQLGEAERFRRE